MGKSTTGPDITDCALYSTEVAKSRSAEVIWLISPAGESEGLPLSCTLIAHRKGVQSLERGEGWAVQGTWPNRAHRTFEGFLFDLVAKLDAEIERQSFVQVVLGA